MFHREFFFQEFPLFMNNSVTELSELAVVPASCGSYQITGNALKVVDVLSSAVRTFLEAGLSIFKAAVHAAVAVVVH